MTVEGETPIVISGPREALDRIRLVDDPPLTDEQRATLAEGLDRALADGWRPTILPPSKPATAMRRFTMYRRGDLSATHTDAQVNPPDEPQFEGVVFSDGSCALRWLTAVHCTSVWASFDDAMTIHGHPEYDSEIVWHDDGVNPPDHRCESECHRVDGEWRCGLCGAPCPAQYHPDVDDDDD